MKLSFPIGILGHLWCLIVSIADLCLLSYLDEGIHLLLLAVRESLQESLGFSPFELVLGHTVRGPLKRLKKNSLR